jgi:uncharacterized protein (TIGR03083 family)
VGTDYDRHRLDEMAAISDLLDDLPDHDFDHPSLCEGWRVRDVISHMCVGYTTPFPSMLGTLARYRFAVPAASREESIAYGSAHTPAELRAEYRRIHTDRVRKGIAHVIPHREGLVDHVIHHSDISRPLGRTNEVPAERLVAALDAAPRIGGFLKARQRAAGLRWIATDVDWSSGDGPEVRGRGEAILLALGGRPVVLDELEGEGVALLRRR